MTPKHLAAALLLAALLPATAVQAKTFRIARAVDLSSWDVHAQNVGVNVSLHAAIYDNVNTVHPAESRVCRNSNH